jgi:hypothetical protein
MYGLSNDTDVSGFVGQELQVIYLGRWQVSLIFTTLADCSVTIEGDYSIAIGGRGSTRFGSPASGACHLGELVTKSIVTADVADNALRLTFDDESVVEVHDSKAAYESYQFTIGGDEFIV